MGPMQDNQIILLALVKAALSGDTSAKIDTDTINWTRVCSLAAKEGVLPLLYDGVAAYAKMGLQLPIEVKMELWGNVRIAEERFLQQKEAISQMASFYKRLGIRMMVLKGFGLSALYPVPEHRVCGDIDTWLYGEQDRADRLLEEEGVEIDRSHHHHTVFYINNVMVENHYDFVNQYAHGSSKAIEKELKRIAEEEKDWDETIAVGEGVEVFTMSPNLGTLFLLRHTAQHFAAENVSLRHVIDWELFVRHHEDKIDWSRIERIAQSSGMLDFYLAWKEVGRSLFDDSELSATAQRVWDEIMSPGFSERMPILGEKTPLKRMVHLFRYNSWSFRRWWANRWKNRLVYGNEPLVNQFWILLRSHHMSPEEELLARQYKRDGKQGEP